MSKKFPIIEIFGPTIQGEGQLAGKRSHFVRFGGCGYRCTWCDSMHAVDPAQVKANRTMMDVEDIVEKLYSLAPAESCPVVTLSGGDPVMWDLYTLVSRLHDRNYKVAVETQGQLYNSWLHQVDYLTVSPKPPSSGMHDKLDMSVINKYASTWNTSFKFVIFDELDLLWVNALLEILPEKELYSVYLSVGTDIHDSSANDDDYVKLKIAEKLGWLYNEVQKYDRLAYATIFPQLHVLAWGNTQGV